MRSLATAAGLATLVLAACAPAHRGGDPCAAANRDINLFSLVGNSASGAYDKCLDDLRIELARARLRATGLRAEAARLESEAATLEGERAAAARRLAAANARQVAALRRVERLEKPETSIGPDCRMCSRGKRRSRKSWRRSIEAAAVSMPTGPTG